MRLDENGFPIPEQYEAHREPGRVTAGRMVWLVLVLGLLAGVGATVPYWEDWGKQLNDWLKALRRNDIDRALERVEAALRRKDHATVVKECDGLLDMAPRSRQLRVIRSSALAELKRYDQAVADCTYLIKQNPNDALALNNRAYFLALARKNIDQALVDVRKALRIQPDQATYRDTLAYLLYLTGEFEAARREFDAILEDEDQRQALGRGESLGEVLFHRGLLFKAMNRKDLAEKDFDAARDQGFKFTEEPQPLRKQL
jgi:tetratricopeptide (TPR) repeat protein